MTELSVATWVGSGGDGGASSATGKRPAAGEFVDSSEAKKGKASSSPSGSKCGSSISSSEQDLVELVASNDSKLEEVTQQFQSRLKSRGDKDAFLKSINALTLTVEENGRRHCTLCTSARSTRDGCCAALLLARTHPTAVCVTVSDEGTWSCCGCLNGSRGDWPIGGAAALYCSCVPTAAQYSEPTQASR
eukprot:2541198-Prymnesium_polylepis.1